MATVWKNEKFSWCFHNNNKTLTKQKNSGFIKKLKQGVENFITDSFCRKVSLKNEHVLCVVNGLYSNDDIPFVIEILLSFYLYNSS